MKLISIIMASIILIGGCLEPTTGKSNSSDSTKANDSSIPKINNSTTDPTPSSTPPKTTDEVSGKRPIEAVIFGKFCGRCISGKCAPMYKIDYSKKELGLDNSNHYSEGAPLVFTKVSDDQYKIAENIKTKIPEALFSSKESKFGCPNCADQCGYYIEILSAGKKYSYELDTNAESMPEFLRDLAGYLDETTAKLRSLNTSGKGK